MQTSGAMLRQTRLKKKLTLTQLSRLTKIPKHVLVSLEKNQFNRLPAKTYIKGFIKNYSQTLRLNPRPVLALFRRDFKLHQKKTLVPKGLSQPLNPPGALTPTLRSLVGIGGLVLLLVFYLTLSLFKLYQPPKLVLFQPENGQQLRSPILVKGKTNHDATLTLNGKTVNLEPDGSFTTVYQGPPGTIELNLKATSRRNKSTIQSVHLIITNEPD